MTEYPICDTPYQEGSIEICSHCGFDLTPYPEFIGEFSRVYQEKEQRQLDSIKQMWVKFQNNPQLNIEIDKLQEIIKTQSENYTQEIELLWDAD